MPVLTKELAEIRPQPQKWSPITSEAFPFMTDFVAKLTEYGRTHPDYVPYLAKYGFKPAGAASSRASEPLLIHPRKAGKSEEIVSAWGSP